MDDNKTTNNTTISDLAAEAAKTNTPTEPKKGKKSQLPLIIALIVILLGVGVALFFILRKPAPESNPEDQEEENSEIVWEAPEDSTDPAADYVNDNQSKIDNPDSTEGEKLDATLSIANLYSVTEKYDEAEALLNAVNRDNLTKLQLWYLYNAYAYLYEHKGDENAYNEYSALSEQTLSEHWDETEARPYDEEGNSTSQSTEE